MLEVETKSQADATSLGGLKDTFIGSNLSLKKRFTLRCAVTYITIDLISVIEWQSLRCYNGYEGHQKVVVTMIMSEWPKIDSL